MSKKIFFLLLIILPGFFTIKAGDDKTKKEPAKKNTDSTQPPKRRGSCLSFEMRDAEKSPVLKLNKQDSTTIPADFPPPPPGAEYCGCHSYLNTAYYVSPLTEVEIFNYYKQALIAQGFFPEEPTVGSTTTQSIMTFGNKDASGHIYTYKERGGFGVTYRSKKPCACEKKGDKSKTAE